MVVYFKAKYRSIYNTYTILINTTILNNKYIYNTYTNIEAKNPLHDVAWLRPIPNNNDRLMMVISVKILTLYLSNYLKKIMKAYPPYWNIAS